MSYWQCQLNEFLSSPCHYKAFVAPNGRIPANVSTPGPGSRDLSGMKASVGAGVGRVNQRPYQILENNFVREEFLLGGASGRQNKKGGGMSEGR